MEGIAAMMASGRGLAIGTFAKAGSRLDFADASGATYLEEDLKVRLLHRSLRSVTVTPGGVP
jgi:hypothetical protein